MTAEDQAAFDHAWRHFALHADQRISVFNFYVASSGLLLSGLAYALTADARLWPMGVAAGLGVATLSLLFWKLDQRSAELIKAAEAAMEEIEVSTLPASRRVLSNIAALPTNASWLFPLGSWSFGRSFRALFLSVGLLGLSGSVLSASGWTQASPATSKHVVAARPAAAGEPPRVSDAQKDTASAIRLGASPTSGPR